MTLFSCLFEKCTIKQVQLFSSPYKRVALTSAKPLQARGPYKRLTGNSPVSVYDASRKLRSPLFSRFTTTIAATTIATTIATAPPPRPHPVDIFFLVRLRERTPGGKYSVFYLSSPRLSIPIPVDLFFALARHHYS